MRNLKVSLYVTSIIFMLPFVENLSPRVLHKCCKEDEFLDEYLNCTKISGNIDNNISSDRYWWFPASSIQNELTKSVIMFDSRPACVINSMDILNVSVGIKEFNFHIRNNDIRLEVLKENTFHDPENGRHDGLSSDTFCVDRGSSETYIAMVCPCSNITCVRTCCLDGYILNMTEKSCRPQEEKLLNNKEFFDWVPKAESSEDYYRLPGFLPPCETWSNRTITTWSVDSQVLLTKDGDIKILGDKEIFSRRDRYCGIYNEAHEEMVIFCLDNTGLDTKAMVYGVIFIIGAICLLATVIVTAILPEMRKNIHGKMALAHNFMLFMGYLSTGIAQLTAASISVSSCEALSLIMQFSILAAFFWLNAMCIDISWTFSGLRPIQGTAMQRDRKKFIYYSLYAWGSTTLISVFTVIVEYSGMDSKFVKPNFCTIQVFFNNKMSELLFFFGPMALLLLANLALFAFTAYKILTVTRETTILNTSESSTNTKNKQTLILYVKLFSLMGVTWLTEVISWAVGGPSHLWYFTDAINLLRAVFIFVIFCCKRSVFNKLHDKVLILFGKSVPIRGTSTTNKNSTTLTAVGQGSSHHF